jgi:hypothetical protein
MPRRVQRQSYVDIVGVRGVLLAVAYYGGVSLCLIMAALILRS